MTVRWRWRDGAHVRIDAQKAGVELEQIETREGKVTPALVLERARSQNSSLHPHFEWDDSAAAEKHRLTQAAELIRSIEVDFTTSNLSRGKSVRAFVSVVERSTGERVYTPMVTAMSNKDMRAQLLRRAWDELLAFREKYKGLTELAKVFAAMDEARAG